MGKRLLFLTNNSSKSREQYVAKFESLGIQATADEIVPSSYAAAAHLASVRFNRTAFVLGPPSSGVARELDAAGIRHVSWPDAAGAWGAERWTPARFEGLEVDATIGAVVLGFDEVRCSYACRRRDGRAFPSTMSERHAHPPPPLPPRRLLTTTGSAMRPRACWSCQTVCLSRLTRTTLTTWVRRTAADHPSLPPPPPNTLPPSPLGNGRMMPGTGCLLAALETATQRRAVNVGKGGAWLLPFLCATYGVQPSDAMIVGDRLDTDIAIGKQGALATALPLTGVATRAALAAAPPDQLPDYVMPCLAVLAGLEPC